MGGGANLMVGTSRSLIDSYGISEFALSSLGLKASLRKWFGTEKPAEVKIP